VAVIYIAKAWVDMAFGVETSHRIAEIALAALKELRLAANPKNIEVWYAHAEGHNPALSRDIQKNLGSDGVITQQDADKLHETHILRGSLANDVIELVGRFEAEMMKLTDVVESTGESASGHGEKLVSLSSQLKESAQDSPAVGALLESVISVTKSMREENLKLEAQLATSSEEVSTLRHSVENIQKEAMTDPLTGVKNRKTFDTEIRRQITSAEQNGSPLTLIFSDVDHFKSFNDKWGHQTGDQVLRLVAEVMDSNVKGQDTLARYGGEEFAIILPNTALDDGRMLADRIRRAIESRRLKKRRTNESLGVVTMSMGVAAYGSGDNAETLIERADQCLYRAKRSGRNAVVDESEPTEAESEEQPAAAQG